MPTCPVTCKSTTPSPVTRTRVILQQALNGGAACDATTLTSQIVSIVGGNNVATIAGLLGQLDRLPANILRLGPMVGVGWVFISYCF